MVEADEYDTAFFDKRSKFVHYRPRTAILNNLEYDHADIFPDLAAIETQFHHLVRTIPANGLIVANGSDAGVARALGRAHGPASSISARGSVGFFSRRARGPVSRFLVNKISKGLVDWQFSGRNNAMNALAAARRRRATPAFRPKSSVDALNNFEGVKRRMEIRGVIGGITVYDDFAHHPTAIRETIAGLRRRVGSQRIIAVLEPRSNTMKLGVMRAALPGSLAHADRVFCYANNLGWDAGAALEPLSTRAAVFADTEVLLQALLPTAQIRRPRPDHEQRRLRKHSCTLAGHAERDSMADAFAHYAFRIVNVFTAGGALTGNPLCVFEDARGLNDKAQQRPCAAVQPFRDHVHPAFGQSHGARAHLHARLRDALRGPSHARLGFRGQCRAAGQR